MAEPLRVNLPFRPAECAVAFGGIAFGEEPAGVNPAVDSVRIVMALQLHADPRDARNSADDIPSLLEHQVDEVRGTPERRRDEVQRHLAFLRNRQVLYEPQVGDRLVELRVRDRGEGPKNPFLEVSLGDLGHRTPGTGRRSYRARGVPFFASAPVLTVQGWMWSFFESSSFFSFFFCCSMSIPHTFAVFSPT